MTSRLIGPPAFGCLALVIALLYAAPTGPTATLLRAQGPDIGTEAQRESGKTLYLKYCVQCHGEKGDGNGYATPHLLPRPRDFTSGKFKVRTTAERSAPDAPGPRQHHQARHALHVDAGLAHPDRSGSVGSRLLHEDLLPRLRGRREYPEALGTSERAGLHERDHRAREEALRGERLSQVPRRSGPGRRTLGFNAG